MLTDRQSQIIGVLKAAPGMQLSMTDLGRSLGKPPGVIQRGLNSLERQGILASHRQGRRRLFRLNPAYPFHDEIARISAYRPETIPTERLSGLNLESRMNYAEVCEPKAEYEASQLKILILAGPNGAGKTTFAREFLQKEASCMQFVNADLIASGLSPFSPEAAAMKAGRLMIRELKEHMAHKRSLALETTLSGSIYARLIPKWREEGYKVKLIFLSLPSVDLAIERVAVRIRQGGHSIPVPTIRRRYDLGRRNFEDKYKSLVDCWTVYDSSGPKPVMIEEGES